MKRIILIILAAVIFLNLNAYSLDTTLIGMRREFFERAKEIKSLLTKSKDIILLNSMYDACIMTMTQLDAYLAIVGIFTTIEEKNLDKAAADYLINWLKRIKSTNELNLKSLNAMTNVFDPSTEAQIKVLRTYFSVLNNQIETELDRITRLKKTLKRKRRR